MHAQSGLCTTSTTAAPMDRPGPTPIISTRSPAPRAPATTIRSRVRNWSPAPRCPIRLPNSQAERDMGSPRGSMRRSLACARAVLTDTTRVTSVSSVPDSSRTRASSSSRALPSRAGTFAAAAVARNCPARRPKSSGRPTVAPGGKSASSPRCSCSSSGTETVATDRSRAKPGRRVSRTALPESPRYEPGCAVQRSTRAELKFSAAVSSALPRAASARRWEMASSRPVNMPLQPWRSSTAMACGSSSSSRWR